METEEFGSVYESLLELTPVISDGGRTFSFLGEADEDAVDRQLRRRPRARRQEAAPRATSARTTGSYYTPDSLVQLLLKEALDPVIDREGRREPRQSGSPTDSQGDRSGLRLGPLPPRRGGKDRPRAC